MKQKILIILNKNNKRNMRYVFLIVVLCMLVGVFGIAAGYFSNYHENSETASHDTITTLSTWTDEDGSLYADFSDGTGKEGVSSNIYRRYGRHFASW